MGKFWNHFFSLDLPYIDLFPIQREDIFGKISSSHQQNWLNMTFKTTKFMMGNQASHHAQAGPRPFSKQKFKQLFGVKSKMKEWGKTTHSEL